jgi:hypothetical protein
LELGTENPRVGNSVITAISMHPEGFDLIGSFLCLSGFLKGLSPVRRAYFSHVQKQLLVLRNGKLYVGVCCEDFYFGIEKAICRAFTTSDLIAHILSKTLLTDLNSLRSGRDWLPVFQYE